MVLLNSLLLFILLVEPFATTDIPTYPPLIVLKLTVLLSQRLSPVAVLLVAELLNTTPAKLVEVDEVLILIVQLLIVLLSALLIICTPNPYSVVVVPPAVITRL